MSIKLPESVVEDLRGRQSVITKLSNEIQLILKTFMATIEGNKVYQLSEDLTELIEVEVPEEIEEDGEIVS